MRYLAWITVCLVALFSTNASAQEKLQLGVSVDVVPVSSSFAGQDIVIFGAIETDNQPDLYRGKYKVIIEVIGAEEEAIVRKKKRIAGIWVNAASKEFTNVPSYYSVLTGDQLVDISDLTQLNAMAIGVDNIRARLVDQSNVEALLTQGEFSSALRRIRIDDGLFSENLESLKLLSPSLFRATLSLPPNVPIGVHKVRAHLFKDGQKLDQIDRSFEIRKVGFERWIYDLAHEQSFLYGILCVILAMVTGWTANAVFRKN